MLSRLRQIGPGAMVAAAFIGPGTITTATLAGANYGYTLLWAVLFSVFATVILQEMSGRLGARGNIGLGEALRQKFTSPFQRMVITALVISAILIGNSAYEAGNLTGATLGFINTAGDNSVHLYLTLAIALTAAMLLLTGKYSVIERTLVLLVSVMGIIFLSAAIIVQPDMGKIINGLFVPRVPTNSVTFILGLIGTTVVPYNLFLHASATKRRWGKSGDSVAARWDTIASIVGGGIITMAILVAAAVAYEQTDDQVNTASQLAASLEPLLGNWAGPVLATGFFAAGFSSTITAPLAAAIATTEILGWSDDLRTPRFRMLWLLVLLSGLLISLTGYDPIRLIVFSQVANGLTLPVIAGLLIWIVNDRRLLGDAVNKPWQNVLALFVLVVTVTLGMKGVLGGLGLI